MKQLYRARLLLIAMPSEDHLQLIRELADWGLPHVAVATRIEDLQCLKPDDVDVAVIDNEALPSDAARNEIGLALPPQELIRLGKPVLLLARDPSRTAMRAADSMGYAALMPRPVPVRVLYRRIGALMQRDRRLERERTVDIRIRDESPQHLRADLA